MQELKDIQGLDQISSWPLALGWWLVIIAGLITFGFACSVTYKFYMYRRSWQYQSYRKLSFLEKQLASDEDIATEDLKLILNRLTLEMRKIAMATASREISAALVGNKWLEWLQKNDPHNYDWRANGKLLVEYQYMPATNKYNMAQVNALVGAAKAWVQTC